MQMQRVSWFLSLRRRCKQQARQHSVRIGIFLFFVLFLPRDVHFGLFDVRSSLARCSLSFVQGRNECEGWETSGGRWEEKTFGRRFGKVKRECTDSWIYVYLPRIFFLKFLKILIFYECLFWCSCCLCTITVPLWIVW